MIEPDEGQTLEKGQNTVRETETDLGQLRDREKDIGQGQDQMKDQMRYLEEEKMIGMKTGLMRKIKIQRNIIEKTEALPNLKARIKRKKDLDLKTENLKEDQGQTAVTQGQTLKIEVTLTEVLKIEKLMVKICQTKTRIERWIMAMLITIYQQISLIKELVSQKCRKRRKTKQSQSMLDILQRLK